MDELKDSYEKIVNRYYMKQNKKMFTLLKIEFRLVNKGMFLSSPKLVFHFSKDELHNYKYEFVVDLKEFRQFIIQELTKEKIEYNDLSRKKFKLLVIKYIRKNYWGNILNQSIKQIADVNIAKQNITNIVDKNIEIRNYYQGNQKQCDVLFDTVHNQFKQRVITHCKNNIRLKHFKVFLPKDLSLSQRFNVFKQYMKEIK